MIRYRPVRERPVGDNWQAFSKNKMARFVDIFDVQKDALKCHKYGTSVLILAQFYFLRERILKTETKHPIVL